MSRDKQEWERGKLGEGRLEVNSPRSLNFQHYPNFALQVTLVK